MITVKPSWVIIAVLTLGSMGLGKLYYNEIQSHATSRAALEERNREVERMNQELLNYSSQVENLKQQAVAYSKATQAIASQAEKQNRKLQDLINRDDTVKAKSGLVTIIVNKGYKKQQLELACITGDTHACEELKP